MTIYNFYSLSACDESHTLPFFAEVVDYNIIGFNTNSSLLHFGKLKVGEYSTRRVSLTVSQPTHVAVRAKEEGIIPSTFILNKSQEIPIIFSSAYPGNFSGEVEVCLKYR